MYWKWNGQTEICGFFTSVVTQTSLPKHSTQEKASKNIFLFDHRNINALNFSIALIQSGIILKYWHSSITRIVSESQNNLNTLYLLYFNIHCTLKYIILFFVMKGEFCALLYHFSSNLTWKKKSPSKSKTFNFLLYKPMKISSLNLVVSHIS